MLRKIIIKLVGKQIQGEVEKIPAPSKAKIVAVVAVLAVAVEQLSAAWGHPVVVPNEVKQLLAAAGLWALRDAIDTKN